MGRYFVISPGAVIALNDKRPDAALQKRSDRRAIVDFVIDNRCQATIDQINSHFGYDCRHKITSLIKVGWLRIIEEKP